MEFIGWIIGVVVIGIPMTYAVLRVAGEIRAEARIRKNVAATKRTEIIDGKEYSVITKPLPILREKRTGRIGIALERGAENDPTMTDGDLTLEPRWIKVQFVRKSDGKIGQVGWRQSAKFETVGTADIDFLTHTAGRFQTESFIRFPTDFNKQ